MKPDQVFRATQSGELHEVVRVTPISRGAAHGLGRAWPDAKVDLRPINGGPNEASEVCASSLCGSASWERLPDDDGETIVWGGGTKVGPVGALASAR